MSRAIWQKKVCQCCVCLSHTGLSYCMAMQPQLLAFVLATRRVPNLNDCGACHNQKLHPYHWEQIMRKVKTPQMQHSTGIYPSPILYNILIYNLPTWSLAQICLCNDCALMHSSRDWQAVQGVLSKDLVTLLAHLKTLLLKLILSKTVSSAIHLYNREASHKFNVSLDGKCRPFTKTLTYLGMKLDRSLT